MLISSSEITFLFKKKGGAGRRTLLFTWSQHSHKPVMRVFPDLFQKQAASGSSASLGSKWLIKLANSLVRSCAQLFPM